MNPWTDTDEELDSCGDAADRAVRLLLYLKNRGTLRFTEQRKRAYYFDPAGGGALRCELR